jgi:hypothetical protein
MRVLTRIGMFSLAKFMGLTMAAMSLVVGVVYGLMLVMMGALGALGAITGGADNALLAGGAGFGMSVVLALGMVVGLPLIYGFFGFTIGLLYAFIINVVLRFTGGLEFEVRDAAGTAA